MMKMTATQKRDMPYTLTTNRLLLLILLVALLLRIAAAFYLGNTVSGLSGAHDEISYSVLGERFADGYGMTFPADWYPWIEEGAPQSYYSFTISLFFAAIYKVFGYQPIAARLVMALLSTLIVLMIYLIGKRFFNERVALLAAGIAAVYAYLIFYGVTLVTETPFTLSLMIAIYLGLRLVEKPSRLLWVAFGIALALTVLLRMAVVFFLPFFFLWLLIRLPDHKSRLFILIPIVIIIMSVLPLTVRNYLMWDQFLLLESQFGHVFWNGNHPGHQGDFHPFEVFPIPEEILQSKNDAQITNELLQLGVRNVLDNPSDFAWLTITRLREFFTFWPTSASTLEANLLRVLSFGLIFPFTLVGLVLNGRYWKDQMVLYAFILVHTGVYAMTWTMIRYRIPLDPFFILYGASAIMIAIRVWKEQASKPAVGV